MKFTYNDKTLYNTDHFVSSLFIRNKIMHPLRRLFSQAGRMLFAVIPSLSSDLTKIKFDNRPGTYHLLRY